MNGVSVELEDDKRKEDRLLDRVGKTADHWDLTF